MGSHLDIRQLTTVNSGYTDQFRTKRKLTVAGTTASAATTVTIDGQSADRYGDHTFAKTGIQLNTGDNNYTFSAQASDALGRSATNVLTVNLDTSVGFTYDANGNLTGDEKRSFGYDEENRLTSVEVAGAWRVEYQYDGLSRRRVRREYAWIDSAWQLGSERRYVVDGKLVIQERDGNNVPLVTYTRGLDLSGTGDGAGGIGGLVARTDHGLYNVDPAKGHAYYHSDGGGNVTAMVNGNGAIMARYLYDPYGGQIR